jgi:hypothetical protein
MQAISEISASAGCCQLQPGQDFTGYQAAPAARMAASATPNIQVMSSLRSNR